MAMALAKWNHQVEYGIEEYWNTYKKAASQEAYGCFGLIPDHFQYGTNYFFCPSAFQQTLTDDRGHRNQNAYFSTGLTKVGGYPNADIGIN